MEVLTIKVLTAEILREVLMDVVIIITTGVIVAAEAVTEVTSRTELKARVKI
jgi:hypothetical protein